MIHTGDNLPILRAMAPASVDLVYLDPPFNSGRDYGEGELSFRDTWTWGPAAEATMATLGAAKNALGRTMAGFLTMLGRTPTMAYLAFMAPRLAELHRVLRATGSIYVHVDPIASPHLRLLLDAIFGADRFRNEVVWHYRRWPTKAKRFQRMHDTLLVYARGEGTTFHELHGYEEISESTRATFGTKKQKASFATGKRKCDVEEGETSGPPLSDVWQVSVLAPIAKERTGYPTQKPERLLERVILASSNPGDVVLDPFCGSGTTIAVATRLGRRGIGIDLNAAAVEITKAREAKSAIPVERSA